MLKHIGDGTNPGPVGKRGGARKNSGRRSTATHRLMELAVMEGKSPAQIVQEVEEGYVKSLRIVSTVLPEILTGLIQKALRGDDHTQKFLVNLYFKYINTLRTPTTVSPIVGLQANLQLILNTARRDMTLDHIDEATTITGDYRVVESATKPDPVGDN